MMPRRNYRPREPRRAARVRHRVVYLRDRPCGKYAFPTYSAAQRIAGRADADHDLRGLDDHHTIYRCRWTGSWHLSSRTPSEVDARRAYYRHREEATR